MIRLEILPPSSFIHALDPTLHSDLSAIHDSAAKAPQLLALIDKGAKESKTKENLGRLWPQECSDSRKVNLALHKDGTTAMGESMVRYL